MHVVQVPGGRRIKLNPESGETFGDVLGACCRAFGGLDPSKWMLRRELRKGLGGHAPSATAPLDIGLPLRLAGLAAGATLEMVPRVGVRAGPVKVAVRVEPTGDNVVGTVQSDSMLWEGLVQLGALPADADASPGAELQPVLRYMQREVKFSRSLKSTTWEGAGVAAGNAARVTLSFRELSPEERVAEFELAEEAKRKAEEGKQSLSSSAAVGEPGLAPRGQQLQQGGQSFSGMFTKPEAQVRREEEEAARARASEAATRSGDGVVERDLRVFVRAKHTEGTSLRGAEEVDDSFYDVTPADVAAALALAKAKEEDQVLKTQAMRDREKEKRIGLIRKVVVRVHMPDDVAVLQANFAPRDKVGALVEAVRGALSDEGRAFSLNVRAPHRLLTGKELDRTFYDAGMAPAANVYLAWAAEGEHAREGLEALKEGLADGAADITEAEKYSAMDVDAINVALQKRIDAVKLPREHKYEDFQSGTAPSSSSTVRKVPKWFKGT